MAMKERYYTVDGQMIGYKDASGRKDFLTDALGSVTAEVDQTGATKTFDGRYKPYGGDLTSIGTRGSYGWIGKWGYRETGLSGSSHYVRRRHFTKISGSWTTIDRLWPTEQAFGYVAGIVTLNMDPSGYLAITSSCQKKRKPCDIVAECKKQEDLWNGSGEKGTICDQDKKVMAIAFCCDGEQKYCPCPRLDMYKNNGAIMHCIAMHERVHCPKTFCKPGKIGFCPGGPGAGECEGYQAEAKCLFEVCFGKTTPTCDEAKKRRKEACELAEWNCKGKLPDGFKEKYCEFK